MQLHCIWILLCSSVRSEIEEMGWDGDSVECDLPCNGSSSEGRLLYSSCFPIDDDNRKLMGDTVSLGSLFDAY